MRSGREVTGRCGRCRRDLGQRSPALVEGLRHAKTGKLVLYKLVRQTPRTRQFLNSIYDQHPRLFPPSRPPESRTQLGDLRNGLAGQPQLECRRCGHRPRPGRRRLYELVEAALERGERDFYID